MIPGRVFALDPFCEPQPAGPSGNQAERHADAYRHGAVKSHGKGHDYGGSGDTGTDENGEIIANWFMACSFRERYMG